MRLCRWALLIVCVSIVAAAHPQNSPNPTKGDGDQPSGTSAAQASSGEAQGSPAAIPDSTQLEAVKTQKADYPITAAEKRIQGQVWLKLTISETGDVEQAEVISGDPVLAEAAVSAAKKWRFKPFIKGGKPVKVATKIPFNFSDKLTEQNVHIRISPAPSNADAKNLSKPILVSQGISEGLLIYKITPIYPPDALQNHIKGAVVLRAVIGKDGHPSNLVPVSGPKELISAAVGAVQQWRYKPYLLMGQPIEIETQITVKF